MQVISDVDFGKIILVTKRTARNVSMRVKPDGLYVTAPSYKGFEVILKVIEPYRKRLLEMQKKLRFRLFSPEYRIDSDFLKLYLEEAEVNQIVLSVQGETACVWYPFGTDFSDLQTQSLLRVTIEKALRGCAQNCLPRLLDYWSERVGLSYNLLKITRARTRWGSCSSSKNISLSYFLILLPTHLIDYVILHELAHTLEMNHGHRFWLLLDKLTNGRALQLDEELRKYRPSF